MDGNKTTKEGLREKGILSQEERIADLERQLAEAKKKHDWFAGLLGAEISRFTKYGNHSETCDYWEGEECNCGFYEARLISGGGTTTTPKRIDKLERQLVLAVSDANNMKACWHEASDDMDKAQKEATRLREKLDRCSELLASEAAECGVLKIQLKEERKEIRLLKEENSEVKDACAEWTALAQRLREALEKVKKIAGKQTKEDSIVTPMDIIYGTCQKALAGDGGQEK